MRFWRRKREPQSPAECVAKDPSWVYWFFKDADTADLILVRETVDHILAERIAA